MIDGKFMSKVSKGIELEKLKWCIYTFHDD